MISEVSQYKEVSQYNQSKGKKYSTRGKSVYGPNKKRKYKKYKGRSHRNQKKSMRAKPPK